jgi:pilus assembly protein CpaF
MLHVTIREKGGQQSTYQFDGSEIRIGRMKSNDVVLPKGNVSKKHARLYREDDALMIEDLDSTNGTYVNGRKVTSDKPIGESDKIYIGDFILQAKTAQGSAPEAGPPDPPSPRQSSPQASHGASVDNNAQTSLGPGGPTDHSENSGSSGPPLDPSEPPSPPDDNGPPATPTSKGRSGPKPSPDDPDPKADTMREPPSAESSAPKSRRSRSQNQRVQSDERPAVDPSAPSQRSDSEAATPGGGNRTTPVLPHVAFADAFDAEANAQQAELAEALLKDVAGHELPLAYPPDPDERDSFAERVRGLADDLDLQGDVDQLVETVTEECVALGALEEYLDEPSIDAIHVNDFDRVILEGEKGRIRAERAFSTPEMLEVVAYRLLGTRDLGVISDEVRFNDGTRAHVVLPPSAPQGPVLSIRKPNHTHATLSDLVDGETLSAEMGEFLEMSVESGQTLLVTGPDQQHRDQVIEALGRHIPEGTRLVSVLRNPQLEFPQASAVRLEISQADGIDADATLETAAAMQPERLILDGAYGAEAYRWIGTVATQAPGSLAGIPGLTASDALARLESACRMRSHEDSPRGLREQVARAVDLVILVGQNNEGAPRIEQITEVQGVDLDTFRLNDVFYFRPDGTAGTFAPTGYIPTYIEDLQQVGRDVDMEIFQE